jgi:hypothetical protein
VLLYNATTTLSWNAGAVAGELARGVFADRAVPPASPWLDATVPARPEVTVGEGPAPDGGREWTLSPLRAGDAEPVRWWLVRWRSNGVWAQQLVFGDERSWTIRPGAAGLDRVAVHAVDAAGNVSAAARWPAAVLASRVSRPASTQSAGVRRRRATIPSPAIPVAISAYVLGSGTVLTWVIDTASSAGPVQHPGVVLAKVRRIVGVVAVKSRVNVSHPIAEGLRPAALKLKVPRSMPPMPTVIVFSVGGPSTFPAIANDSRYVPPSVSVTSW